VFATRDVSRGGQFVDDLEGKDGVELAAEDDYGASGCGQARARRSIVLASPTRKWLITSRFATGRVNCSGLSG
jgi:hypothetical protein